jgi:hypothetical protein
VCINVVPNYRRHNLQVVYWQDLENLDTTASQYGIEHCSIKLLHWTKEALKDGVAKFHWRVGTAHIHYWLVPHYTTPLHKHVCCVPLETTRCEQPCKNARMPFTGRSRSYQMSQSSFLLILVVKNWAFLLSVGFLSHCAPVSHHFFLKLCCH